jgi:hypothetical protein
MAGSLRGHGCGVVGLHADLERLPGVRLQADVPDRLGWLA